MNVEQDRVVVLDERGKELGSEGIAQLIAQARLLHFCLMPVPGDACHVTCIAVPLSRCLGGSQRK